MFLMQRRRGPVAGSFVTAVGAVVLLGGCWSAPAGPASAAGTRVVGQEVQFWLGGACGDVTAIDVDLRDEERVTKDTWSVESTGGATIERFTVGVVPEGFAEIDPLEVDVTTVDIAVATVTRAGDSEPVQVVALIFDLLEDPAPGDAWRLAFYGWIDVDEIRDLIADGELAPECDRIPPVAGAEPASDRFPGLMHPVRSALSA